MEQAFSLEANRGIARIISTAIHKALLMAASLSQMNPIDTLSLHHPITIHFNIYPRV